MILDLIVLYVCIPTCALCLAAAFVMAQNRRYGKGTISPLLERILQDSSAREELSHALINRDPNQPIHIDGKTYCIRSNSIRPKN